MTLKTSNSTETRSWRSGSGTIYPAAPCPESLLDQLAPSEIKVSYPKVSENKECWWMSIKRPRTDYFIAEPRSLVNLLFSVKQSEIWVRDYKSTHPRKFGNHVTVYSKTNAWRAASLRDRNMGENLSPIWPEGHCLNSAKHRPLTAWNHTWAEMRISFRGLLWSFIWHIFQLLILADTTKKLMRWTQLKKRTW